MPDIIHLLPEYLANQIAAGEVVQRPASVVKELLENAVDAGATQVQLIVKEAGKQLVQVVDNGAGMSPTDARMSLERHATSKIRSTEDLFKIRTLGFRGEALASIAAVAQVEIRTKQREHDTGTLLLVEGSQITSQQPTACPDGTSISVKNLFFNVPARRNFLKSNAVEMRHILDEFQHVALANPQIAFSLYQNDLEVFGLPAGKLSQRIVALLGNGYKEQLAACEEVTHAISVRGFVGKPESSKKSRGDQFFFVNNRFIRSAYLNHAVLAAYEGLLARDTHPFYVLFLELDPKTIDINVHPTKTEIKFEDEKTVYAVVRAAVKQSLGIHNIAPSLDFDGDVNFAPIRPLRAGKGTGEAPTTANDHLPAATPAARAASAADTFRPDALAAAAAAATRSPAANNSGFSNFSPETRRDGYERQLPPRPTEQARRELEAFYRELGQPVREDRTVGADNPVVRSFEADAPAELAAPPVEKPDFSLGLTMPDAGPTAPAVPAREGGAASRAVQVQQRYVLVPVKSGVLLIDQEAARERILYEQYRQELGQAVGSSQTLLFPRTVTFSPADFAVLRELTEPLHALGFIFTEFGPNTIAVEAIPAGMPAQNEKELLEGLIEQFRTTAGPLKLDQSERLARALARRVAAGTAGTRLPEAELSALADRLFACQTPGYTPDGRKTLVLLDGQQLADFFRK
ncbi:DNA mismatch repair endonuclease MutL [Hymenobacter properus]|uniref:DNA mismatch repair protein MutL n=1 Tax=Hymenobacter properus TaxID=2791026 RepID=A0A931FJX1_9BACT|nr:DNA mismatch repair endonuclease MutL [Hymenobacter properus]MBF9143397.1 DNA mismatch repair endonuclease MutL [Hymenobacter properus]MBR7722210.1 DNA mismatch repair endonuclease MutL [Microvirga sp. SRT04]